MTSKRLLLGSRRHDTCDSCTSRRSFLQTAIGSAAGLGAAVFLTDRGGQLPIGEARALAAQADQLTYPVPPADGVTIDRDNQVIVVRYQGAVYAFNLACPHEHAALRWRQDDGRFQCPRHQSKYRPDGTFISGRATRNMDRFAVRRDGDKLVVDVGQLYRSDDNPNEWAAAEVKV